MFFVFLFYQENYCMCILCGKIRFDLVDLLSDENLACGKLGVKGEPWLLSNVLLNISSWLCLQLMEKIIPVVERRKPARVLRRVRSSAW